MYYIYIYIYIYVYIYVYIGDLAEMLANYGGIRRRNKAARCFASSPFAYFNLQEGTGWVRFVPVPDFFDNSSIMK